MKQIEIYGAKYPGFYTKTRSACRAVVICEGKMLLSYETLTGQWMIPGGGIEEDEDEKECCVREVAEETGYVIEPSECLLEIVEYYADARWISRYFTGKIVGQTERKLTNREKEVGMEPVWLEVNRIREIFADFNSYAETDEMRRGLYQREYTALEALADQPVLL